MVGVQSVVTICKHFAAIQQVNGNLPFFVLHTKGEDTDGEVNLWTESSKEKILVPIVSSLTNTTCKLSG